MPKPELKVLSPPASPGPSRGSKLRAQISVYGVGMFCEGAGAVVIPLWLLSIGTSPAVFGVLLGARGLLPLLFAIHGGVLMDKCGARRVLLLVGALGIVLPILFPLAPSVWLALVLQMLLGLITTLGWVGAQTCVSQHLSKDRKCIRRLSFSNRLGVFMCPLLAGLSWDLFGAIGGFAAMFLFAALFMLSALLLPKGELDASQIYQRLTPRLFIPSPRDYLEAFKLFAIPAVLLTSVASCINVSVGTIHQSFYIVYLDQLGFSGTLIGFLVAGPNLLGIAGTLWLGNQIKRLGEVRVLFALVIVSSLATAATPLLGAFLPLLLIASVRGWSMGAAQPLMISVPSRSAPLDKQGSAAGLRITLNRLVQTVLPPGMGVLIQFSGLNNSFLIVGGLLLAIGIYCYRYASNHDPEQH